MYLIIAVQRCGWYHWCVQG